MNRLFESRVQSYFFPAYYKAGEIKNKENENNKEINMKNLKLSTRLLLGMGVIQFAVVVIVFISFNNSNKIIERSNWVVHTQEVLTNISSIKRVLVDMETGQRGYIITGDEDYLEPYNNSLSIIENEIAELDKLTSDNSIQTKHIEIINELVKRKVQELNQTIELRRNNGFEATQQIIRTNKGKLIMDDIRHQIRLMTNEELRLLQIRSMKPEQAKKLTNKTLILILVLYFVVGLIISWLFLRSVITPIKKLQKGTLEVGNGNLNYKFTNTSKDEIGQLSRSINNMLNNLKATTTTNDKLLIEVENRNIVEEKIKEKSKELEKHFQKSEEQRIATLSVLSDLNETTRNLKMEIAERKIAEQIQKVLYNISNAVITTENLDELIKRIQKELGTIIDTTNFYIALYNNETETISLPFFKDEKDMITSFPAGKTLTYYVIKSQKSLFATKEKINKLEKSGKVESFGEDSEIWLGVPLKIEGKVTGVLAVQSYTDENAYDESDMEILEFVSHQISISIERKKAEENLISALEKAQESDRLKSAFLTNMSHEIRTPMNGILGFTELLKEPQLTGEEQKNYIKIIEKSGGRMLNTINDIIDISRIEAGQIEVEKTEVSISKILEEQCNFFDREAKAKGLELIYKPALSDMIAHIVTDKQKLESILTNLIKNAIKFTKKGNISFGCLLKKERNFKRLEFYVKDTGIGIPTDRISAIFNRFEQADIEDTQVFEGSGLGLAISKSYVEMLGGNISVISEEGTGSTFVFTIPYTKHNTKESDAEENINIDQQISLKNLSVIIAEDDEASLLFLKAVFKNKFKKITFTETGKETLDEFQENPETNIILMDLKMPLVSGYEATREIRKVNQDVVIIAQTAHGLSGDKEKAIEAGCDDYIAKPINKEMLLKKIMFHLSKKAFNRIVG